MTGMELFDPFGRLTIQSVVKLCELAKYKFDKEAEVIRLQLETQIREIELFYADQKKTRDLTHAQWSETYSLLKSFVENAIETKDPELLKACLPHVGLFIEHSPNYLGMFVESLNKRAMLTNERKNSEIEGNIIDI